MGAPMIDTDEHLQAIMSGDVAAFARWMSLVEPTVRAGLRSYAARVDAEAVLQETMLRVWQVAPRHAPDGRPNSLFRLAIRIARNLAIDEVRRAKSSPVPDEGLEALLAEADTGAAFSGPDPFLRRAIQECQSKLPDRPAEVLHCRLTSGASEPDQTLAERLGMKLNTFLQNFTRARKLLAECLAKRRIDIELEMG